MAIKITMPKLGLTMVEGTITEWKKREGEYIDKGTILFVLETEKVTFEVEAPASGILGTILVKVGETAPVGGLLGYILQEGEKLEDVDSQPKEIPGPLRKEVISQTTPTLAPPAETAGMAIKEGKISISPLARKIAEEHKIDISGIRGTGPEGRIVKEDILKAVDETKSRGGKKKRGLQNLPSKGN